MRLSLEALAVLEAIDRRGSFAAAADELHRVPSSLSYTIRTLEEDLDVLVFDRRGHRARLTAAGRALLEEGRRLLAQAGEVEHRVRRIATGWEAELRIAVDALIPLERLWPLCARFYAACAASDAAHTRLQLLREVLGGTWDALATGRADLLIGASGEPPPGGGYRSRVIAEVSAVFAVAPSHPLATATEPIPEAEIVRHRAVVAADSSRRLPPRTVGLLTGQDTLTVPDLSTKLAAQVAGLGCGFLPAHLAAGAVAAGRLVVKEVETARPPWRLVMAWRESRPGKALAWWIDAVGRADWAFVAPAPAVPSTAPRLEPRARARRSRR